MKKILLATILIFFLVAISIVDAKKGKGGKKKKNKKAKYSTMVMTMTQTAETRTVMHTVIKEMRAPTAYTKSGDCYCQI